MPRRLHVRLSAALQRGVCAAWLAVAVAAPISLTALGCSTPSVPLPPPTVDTTALTFTQKSPGQIAIVGVARPTHANVVFYVLDQKTGDGVIATAAADGSFETPPFGFTIGGTAEVYFVQTDGLRSESTCVTVELSAPLFGATCQ